MNKSIVKKRKSKKGSSTISIENKIGKELTMKQDMFCVLYVKNKELFGNGTLSYATAYNYNFDTMSREAVYEEIFNDETGEITHGKKIEDSEYDKAYNICSVKAHWLLRNGKVNERINALLNELMTIENADSELAWVMSQRTDLGPKVQALKEFNKLKNRVIDKKQLEIKGLNLKMLYEIANGTDDDDE